MPNCAEQAGTTTAVRMETNKSSSALPLSNLLAYLQQLHKALAHQLGIPHCGGAHHQVERRLVIRALLQASRQPMVIIKNNQLQCKYASRLNKPLHS